MSSCSIYHVVYCSSSGVVCEIYGVYHREMMPILFLFVSKMQIAISQRKGTQISNHFAVFL